MIKTNFLIQELFSQVPLVSLDTTAFADINHIVFLGLGSSMDIETHVIIMVVV